LATAAEIRRVLRPFVASDPRLVMIKRTIVVRPVGHYLHGYHFRTTSFGGVYPIVMLFQPMYVPRVNIPFGGMPEDHGRVRRWQVTDPGVEQGLIEDLGGDLLDSLLRIDTPDKFLVWADHLGLSSDLSMLTEALAGRRARAALLARRQIADYAGRYPAGDPTSLYWGRRRVRRLCRFVRIFESGQARTNRLLRTFERINARNTGVEAWWRWSPVVE
jgi:hypothetical protein